MLLDWMTFAAAVDGVWSSCVNSFLNELNLLVLVMRLLLSTNVALSISSHSVRPYLLFSEPLYH